MRNVWDDSVQPVLDSDRVQVWDDVWPIDESLQLVAAPGHTPGNAVLTLASGADRALFVGDLLHSPVQFALPDWNNCMCEDAVASRESRRRILARAADDRALVFGGHFGGDQGAEVARTPTGFTVRGWRP
jgi:glyoxylase-like metal-dependent hydrolase (beta-lactamase superfamily II)